MNREVTLVDNQYIRVTEQLAGNVIACTDIEYMLYKKDWSTMYLKRCKYYLQYAKKIAPILNKKYNLVKDRNYYTEDV